MRLSGMASTNWLFLGNIPMTGMSDRRPIGWMWPWKLFLCPWDNGALPMLPFQQCHVCKEHYEVRGRPRGMRDGDAAEVLQSSIIMQAVLSAVPLLLRRNFINHQLSCVWYGWKDSPRDNWARPDHKNMIKIYNISHMSFPTGENIF